MIKIGKVRLGVLPKIAVSVNDTADEKRVKSLNADILEIRVDQFKILDPEYVNRVIARVKKIGIPLILTVRSHEEGGEKNLPDELKLRIFKSAISLVDAVDIELKSPVISEVVKIAKKNKKLIIVSWHNFKLTPGDRALKGILNDALKKGAQLVKVAVRARKADDVNRLMKFTMQNRASNLITISLGKVGRISRLIFPMAGSLITYAYITKPSGPGQTPLKDLRRHLRMHYPQCRRSTK
ncbi:MAG: type I 3-dehydroquinate dehydratase [Candidatus Omnitrophota bacterium]|nr:type I 3-dehydroquinate dehydratase [Candidatus Omnitrophota bacterium]